MRLFASEILLLICQISQETSLSTDWHSVTLLRWSSLVES
ncbi:hypothetical protein E2C01_100541 [Portunus trituberculatus]|uniref:Uncharacterized protein n=1 Tax=Portunus trituberculatus TaxID=210409 RepID=A0A5B7KCH4_PORTR|nr:hypothetical protein [Portunus trituberculatus]